MGSPMDKFVQKGYAVGEIGLDYFEGTEWGHQRWVLGNFFPIGYIVHTPLCSTCGELLLTL